MCADLLRIDAECRNPPMAASQDVAAFLASIGREDCLHAVVQQGFFTSLDALRGATYQELVDCGVRQTHAKLIISSIGSAGALPLGPAAAGLDEVATFLRSIGLENCGQTVHDAGYTNLDQLAEASMQELLAAGLKTVHCRLIISNLSAASAAGPPPSSVGAALTPIAQRMHSLEENSLLGGSGLVRARRAALACPVDRPLA